MHTGLKRARGKQEKDEDAKIDAENSWSTCRDQIIRQQYSHGHRRLNNGEYLPHSTKIFLADRGRAKTVDGFRYCKRGNE